jgi:cytochrome c oxidase assembly factor CtaG
VPSFSEFLSTWSFDMVSLLVILATGVAYLVLLAMLRRRGQTWPIWRTLSFFILGLGAYAFVEFGFFGTYRFELRWAFTTRIALLLYAVPLLLSLGRPLELARAARNDASRARFDKFLQSWPIRVVSNAIFAPLFALAFFMLFITPLSAAMRGSAFWQHAITVGAFLLGQLMLFPMLQRREHRSEIFMAAEFLFAFFELMLDAIPGVVLSISNTVLDGATTLTANVPAWFPTALDDQHFSGNLLWMIAEGADIPILVLLFIRWRHQDTKTAKSIDDLSDEQFDALANQHLKRPRG